MKKHVINALRQIETSASEGIWGAHRGCAAIAGALLVHENLVSEAAKGRVSAYIHSVLDTEEGVPNPKAAISFNSFTHCLLQEVGVDAQVPREIGHDVIYSAYVLRALDAFQINPWASLLEALITLVRKVKVSGPGWVTVNGKNEMRPYTAAAEAVESSFWARFNQFSRPRSMEIGDMQLGHLLTHGHAIEVLRRYGSEPLFSDLDVAYRKRLHCLQVANHEERDQTSLEQKALDPRLENYWGCMETLGDMHGHIVKYAFSFLDLKRDEISTQDLEAFSRIVWPDRSSLSP